VSTVPTLNADWTRLWRLARRVGATTQEEPDYVFLPIGLRLEDPARAQAWDTASTPANAVTFASSGGNGVHFSFVSPGDGGGAAAVVMTVPVAFDSPNHVVGEDLREFLALGYWIGYFSLERLAYRWGGRDTIARLQAGPPPSDPEEAGLLRHLVTEFDLRPWPDVERRLTELDATRP
jgi:hypothetical protein